MLPVGLQRIAVAENGEVECFGHAVSPIARARAAILLLIRCAPSSPRPPAAIRDRAVDRDQANIAGQPTYGYRRVHTMIPRHRSHQSECASKEQLPLMTVTNLTGGTGRDTLRQVSRHFYSNRCDTIGLDRHSIRLNSQSHRTLEAEAQDRDHFYAD
jgi:hypothetical protein